MLNRRLIDLPCRMDALGIMRQSQLLSPAAPVMLAKLCESAADGYGARFDAAASKAAAD